MQKIKEVGVVSLAKIMAVIYALFGFLIGLFVALSKLTGFETASSEGAQMQSVGYAAVIIFPIVYAVIGAVSGLISGFFFNKAASWVGPLDVSIVQTQAPAQE